MSGGDQWGRHSCLPAHQCGTVVLSIDLELDLEHHNRQLQQRLDEVRSQLIEVTQAYSVPATWAVADPMLSAATESILTAGCGHEIAVLGDQAWLGPGCGRARLARELTRRFSAPRKAGIPVNTLALRNVELVVDLDLLVEHGVTAFCGPAVEMSPAVRGPSQPPTRFGLWQPPAAWTLPPRARWWSPAAWSIRREVKRASCNGSTLHLRLDAVRFVDSPGHALDGVTGLFRYLADRRDSGRLAIETIGRLAAAALDCRAGSPSRSALRPAA
jgi:hypothetical protein